MVDWMFSESNPKPYICYLKSLHFILYSPIPTLNYHAVQQCLPLLKLVNLSSLSVLEEAISQKLDQSKCTSTYLCTWDINNFQSFRLEKKH